jgi:hypothetical protein
VSPSASKVIDLEDFEVPLTSTLASHPLVQKAPIVSKTQEVWKGGIECIIID